MNFKIKDNLNLKMVVDGPQMDTTRMNKNIVLLNTKVLHESKCISTFYAFHIPFFGACKMLVQQYIFYYGSQNAWSLFLYKMQARTVVVIRPYLIHFKHQDNKKTSHCTLEFKLSLAATASFLEHTLHFVALESKNNVC